MIAALSALIQNGRALFYGEVVKSRYKGACFPVAYEADSREGEFDYLGDGWISADHDEIVLTGMEPLQAAFRKDWIGEEDFAREICECQVVFKFMRLIQAVSGRMKQFRHPLVVSSHDWESFLRIKPVEKKAA